MSELFQIVLGKLEDSLEEVNVTFPAGYNQPRMFSDVLGATTVSNPNIFAQLLMGHLDGPMEVSPEVFNMSDKQWWLQVAAYMGPDYLSKLRKVTAWMIKCDEFV